ncbi:unknown [Acidiphilium sp. CAG:727]|nr:unknown [Acidiphilium sp. CAG:727]
MKIKKILCLLTVLSVAFCSCFLFTGCKKESAENKKYDVSIKVKNNFDSEWIFEPGVEKLYYTFEYTGKEMRFWIDSWNLPKHPRWSNEWFKPNTSGANVFHADYGKIGQMYYEEDPKFICERGEYYYRVYADSTSDLWNSRRVFLFITVI